MTAPAFTSALLVEDEPSLRLTLTLALRARLGIADVREAPTLADARRAMADPGVPPPELVVLDRMLPDGEGLDLVVELRAAGFRGAILVLTAYDPSEERARGLNLGADDYLGKPFALAELEARVSALARRIRAAPAPAADPALWRRDPERLRIFGPRGWVQLTPLEFRLIERLADAGGAIVSRESLLKDVWGFHLLPKTRTVDLFLSRLRKHFELDAENPRHLLTVRGAGYRFEA